MNEDAASQPADPSARPGDPAAQSANPTAVPPAAKVVFLLGVIGMATVIALLASGSPFPSEFQEWIGKPCPNFTVETIDGESVSIESLRGRKVVLNFWAISCAPCREELPNFQLCSKQFGDEVAVVGISWEPIDWTRDFAQRVGITYPLARAVELPEPFSQIDAIPVTFVLGDDGTIRHAHTGFCSYEQLLEYLGV